MTDKDKARIKDLRDLYLKQGALGVSDYTEMTRLLLKALNDGETDRDEGVAQAWYAHTLASVDHNEPTVKRDLNSQLVFTEEA